MVRPRSIFAGTPVSLRYYLPQVVWFRTCANSVCDRLRVGWLNRFSFITSTGASLGGVPREQKMLKGHLPRVIYHQVYNVYEDNGVCGQAAEAMEHIRRNPCVPAVLPTIGMVQDMHYFVRILVYLVIYDSG